MGSTIVKDHLNTSTLPEASLQLICHHLSIKPVASASAAVGSSNLLLDIIGVSLVL